MSNSVVGNVALLFATTNKTSSSPITFVILILVVVAFYFVFMRPRSQQAKRQRQEGANIAVGDEIVTIGGIVGTILDITDDRVTIVTGTASTQGVVDGPPPHHLVMLRQAIARKLPPVNQFESDVDEDEPDDDDEHDESDEHDAGEGDEQDEHDEHDADEGDGDESDDHEVAGVDRSAADAVEPTAGDQKNGEGQASSGEGNH